MGGSPKEYYLKNKSEKKRSLFTALILAKTKTKLYYIYVIIYIYTV